LIKNSRIYPKKHCFLTGKSKVGLKDMIEELRIKREDDKVKDY